MNESFPNGDSVPCDSPHGTDRKSVVGPAVCCVLVMLLCFVFMFTHQTGMASSTGTLRAVDVLLMLLFVSILGLIVLYERGARRAETAELSVQELNVEGQQFRDSLLEREAHLRLALGQMPTLAWTTDAQMRVTSTLGADLFSSGLTPEQIIRRLTAPVPSIAASYEKALSGESICHDLEWKGRTFEVRVESLRNTDQVITGTVGVAVDVSDRKRSLAQLQERARQQAAVAELGQQALSCRNLEEVLNTAVRLVHEILAVEYCCVAVPTGTDGVRLAAGLGWNSKYKAGTVLDDSVDSLSMHAIKTGHSIVLIDLEEDQRFRHSRLLREHRVVSGLSFLLRGLDQCHGVLGAFTRNNRIFSQDDANFLHAIANTLAARMTQESVKETQVQLEDQLRQAQKMEAIGQLAGGVAHDFNNLLCVIIGYSEFVHRALPADSTSRKFVDEIKHAADRAASLTRQLLAFSRRQVLVPTVLNLNDLVANTQKFLNRLIGEHIELTTDLDSKLEPIKADAGQIEQVIMNLAVNARDAMPHGGKVIVRTTNVRLRANDLRNHPECNPGVYAVLEVADTGCGMSPETLKRIFEPFFTTKEVGKGTGLGLATVYGIIKQSGGHIKVDSKVNKGTTFSVFIPTLTDQPSTMISPVVARQMPRGTETILLVEDEPSVRALAEQTLTSCGYGVIVAGDGVEALETVLRLEKKIDLMLTDVVMPRLSGGQAARLVVEKCPTMKVLFMSGYTDTSLVRNGISSGDMECLFKPFTPGDLAEAVRKTLDQPSVETTTRTQARADSRIS